MSRIISPPDEAEIRYLLQEAQAMGIDVPPCPLHDPTPHRLHTWAGIACGILQGLFIYDKRHDVLYRVGKLPPV